MVTRTSYLPGTPSWVDLGSPDPEAAAAFYGGLFGWSVEASPDPAAGGYRMAMLRGQPVAGIGPQMNADMPPFWTVYVTVADADAAVAAATGNGATAVVPPMDVLDVGRMAILQDPVGSFVALWQPRAHQGAGIVNEPGTFTWNELATTDVGKARDFYTATFGWGISEEGTSDTAVIFTLAGEVLCGAHTAGDGEFPAWSVWFAVEDCDASAAKAAELGGTILVPPNDRGFGRGAVIADPHGAVFGIGAMAGDA
jgi:predicted enzyme related to lactoylglutathione lyase